MRIQTKLFSIFIVSSVFLLVTLLLIIQWSLEKGMLDYINSREIRALEPVSASLISVYQRTNSWQEMQENHQAFHRLIETNLPVSEFQMGRQLTNGVSVEGQHAGESQGRRFDSDNQQQRRAQQDISQRPTFPLIDSPGRSGVNYVLLDADKRYVVGIYPPDKNYNFIELAVAGELVGYLLVSKREHLSAQDELNFVDQQQRYLSLMALGILLLSMLITLPLLKYCLHPIRQLRAAMSRLTQGDYEQRLDFKPEDGFSHLSRDFNELAQTLQSNEVDRKRWLGDISDELDTPIAVLKSEIEAMLDDLRPLSLTQLGSANVVLQQLQQLIEDLHELTRSDLGAMRYRKTVVELADFLLEEVEKYLPILAKKNIHINLILQKSSVILYADPKRLQQLFGHLFTHISKYAQGANQVQLTMFIEDGMARIVLEDNGQGVDEQHLAQIFDSLNRVDGTRSRDTGAGDLSLAMCEQIVAAHHGQIMACRSSLGGIAIHMKFPLYK